MKRRYDFVDTTPFNVVDCLECENYYTSACDGNAGGCKAYTPIRRVTMAEDIAEIKTHCKATGILVLGISLAYLIQLIGLIIAIL